MDHTRIVTLLFVLVTFGRPATAQHLYKFHPYPSVQTQEQDYCIDLEQLTSIKDTTSGREFFQKFGEYSARFYFYDGAFANPLLTRYKGHTFKITDDHHVEVLNETGKRIKTITDTEKHSRFDINSNCPNFLVPTTTGVVQVKDYEGEDGYVIYKYDENGIRIFRKLIAHSDIEKKDNTNYIERYLHYLDRTDKLIVFSSGFIFNSKKIFKTHVLNTENGEIKTYDFACTSVIKDEHERDIIGFLQSNYDGDTLHIILSDHKWRLIMPNKWDHSTEILVKDNILVIAKYSFGTCGCDLYAYSLNTGKKLWTADVIKKLFSHSEYENKVYLSLYKNKVILEGNESYVNYVQIFDVYSGKRLFSTEPDERHEK